MIEKGKGNLLEKFLKDSQKGGVVISTAHKAKGLEWNDVLVCSDFFEAETFLSEEEFRLFYVACTRAKNNLHLQFSQRNLLKILKKSKYIIDKNKKS